MSIERVLLLSCLLSCCLVIAASASRSVLLPEAACTRLENYTVTSLERYEEPVTVETFAWCLQIPPRCKMTRTEMRERYTLKTEIRTRTVNECCEGYKMVSVDDSDAPVCAPICKQCVAGICVSPGHCECYPGYTGENCSIVCKPHTWGPACKHECDCGENVTCNFLDGKCPCPRGLSGPTCNESCPEHRWGPDCAFSCNCDGNRCDPATGKCVAIETPRYETAEAANTTLPDDRQESSSTPPETTVTLETKAGDEASVPSDNLPRTTSPETTAASSPDQPRTRTQTSEDANPSTARPVIVLVSVPERRRNLEKDKFAIQNPFLRHRDVVEDHLHELPTLKSDYEKHIHKDMMHVSSIPLDIALIVVASIFSLGLTSVAVVLVLYVRSKLLETARVSIYEVEKTKSQENTGTIDKRNPSLVNTSTQSPIREIPAFFTSTPEAGTILTIPTIDPNSNYANGAAAIGFRISGNLRDFLQDDHYDRPPSTRIRLQTFGCETTPEHIYDEIPL
ncbi:uncharacterized protein LOC144467785 [Augochlora pura]